MVKKVILLLPLILLLAGCDKGIAPVYDTEEAGFSGTITFKGEWPDSVKRTHIIVFKDPINTAADFNILNLAYIGKEIPAGSSEITYNSVTDTAFVKIKAGTYKYIVVAQSSTEEVSLERKDWYVAGIYYAGGNTSVPGVLTIPENTLVPQINITCDFNNRPPQPPGGN